MMDLVRKTRLYNLIFGISVLILTILFVYLPMRDELIRSLLDNWTAMARANYMTFQIFTEKSLEGARGISSRSVIRDAILKYNEGQLGWNELAEFTQPKFEDGVKILENLQYAFRVVDEDILVAYNPLSEFVVEDEYLSIPDRDGQIDIFFSHNRYHLIVYSDIQHNGKTLGTDILIYDMTSLLDEMNSDRLQVEIIDSKKLNQTNYGLVHAEADNYKVTRDRGIIHYIHEIDAGRYYLHMYAPYKEIIRSSQSRINIQLAMFILGIVFLFVLFNMVILRQANKLLHESESSRDVYKKLAYQDTLTNAYSRLSLDHWLVDQKMHNTQNVFSIAMLDIDSFKYINDAYGHQVGDEVLIKLANTINTIIRKEDILVRYGGDEFLIIFENARESHVVEILNRIQMRLDKENIYEFPVQVSYGIVELNNIKDYADAVILADKRMYIHKNSKKPAD